VSISGEVSISKIYVIQSLRDEDIKTAHEVFRDVLTAPGAGISFPPANYFECTSRSTLRSVIDRIVDDVLPNGAPFLHLEAHGSDTGLRMKNGDFLKWDEFLRELRLVNMVSKHRLNLFMPTCHGIRAFTGTKFSDRASFVNLVAPADAISGGAVRDAVPEFYRYLFNYKVIRLAIEAVNQQLRNEEHLQFISTDKLFLVAFANYIRTYTSARARVRRAEEIMTEVWADLSVQAAFGEIGSARKWVKQKLAGPEENHFDDVSRRFFWRDVFESAEERTGVTFEAALKLAKATS